MQIYIVRHGDPDYEHDSLTPKGDADAKLLAERLAKLNVTAFYCSPLGRAKRTASYTLEKTGRKAETLDWLREFEGRVPTHEGGHGCPWDRYPSYWTTVDDYYDYEKWDKVPLMAEYGVGDCYREVTEKLDAFLAGHGYVREGRLYRAVRPNADVIVLFCHFGVESVILSHLFCISPVILWHNFRALTTSVTHLVTEEREDGIAQFVALRYGDLGHLDAAGEDPAFAARFCERFTDDTRH